jgi:hypothetical protein
MQEKLFTQAQRSPLHGLRVKLARNIDKTKPCHRNVATVHPGKGPHAGELRCADCDRHRGWLSKEVGTQLLAIIEKFGMPTEPLIIRNDAYSRFHRAGGNRFNPARDNEVPNGTTTEDAHGR